MKRHSIPVQKFLRPLLLMSLALHGLVLFLPFSANETPKSEEQATVRVVRLPKQAKLERPPTPNPLPIQSVSKGPRALTVAAKPKQQPAKPAKQKVKPTVPALRKQSAQQPSASTANSQTSSRPDSASRSPKAQPSTPPINPNDLVVNLERLPDTQPCEKFEGCWKSGNSQWRSVDKDVQQLLFEQGYEVKQLDLEEDIGFNVYQVSKNGVSKTYYLHLLSTLKGTIYVLNPKQFSRDELEQKVRA